MNLRSLGLVIGILITSPAYADEATTVLKGKAEIEKAVADQIKKNPKITVKPTAGHQSGNVIWVYGDFMFPNGPTGHYGITAVNDAGLWHIAMHISNVAPPKQQ